LQNNVFLFGGLTGRIGRKLQHKRNSATFRKFNYKKEASQNEVPLCYYSIEKSLFLLFFLLGLGFLGGLVALVQTVDDVLGDVETLVGHQDVVTCL